MNYKMLAKKLGPFFVLTAICGMVIGGVQEIHMKDEKRSAICAILFIISAIPLFAVLWPLRDTMPHQDGLGLMASTVFINGVILLFSAFAGSVFCQIFLGHFL